MRRVIAIDFLSYWLLIAMVRTTCPGLRHGRQTIHRRIKNIVTSFSAIMAPAPMPKNAEEREALRSYVRTTVLAMLEPNSTVVTWQQVAGKSVDDGGLVYKAWHEGLKFTVWKTEATLPTSVEKYSEHLLKNRELEWVPQLEKYEIVEETDPTWHVSRTVVKGAMTIAPRDYVEINFGEPFAGDGFMTLATAVDHPKVPEQPNYVRGEHLPSGSIVRPIEGKPNHCSFVWANSVDMKGHVPKKLIELASGGFMLKCCEALIEKCQKL